MKMTLTTHEAAVILMQDRNANWSPAGAFALAGYLEEIEEAGEELELDVVAIRCDFSEWSDLQAWAQDYFTDWRADLSIEDDMDDDEIDDIIREHICDNGTLIEFDGGVIVSSF